MTQLASDQLFQRAVQHHSAGRLAEAEKLYRQVLAQNPNHADATHNLGILASACNQWPAAIELAQRSIALSPRTPHYYLNLGAFLYHVGRHDDAIRAYQTVLQLDPRSASAYFNLGCALQAKELTQDAIVAYQNALRFQPNHVDALNNLGNVLRLGGQLEKAIAHFRQALAINPNFWGAQRNLGNALAELGLLDDAMTAFNRAVELNPADSTTAGNRLFNLHFHPAYDQHAILVEHQKWARRYADPLKPLIRPHENDRNPERRLRVGYVGPFFRSHAVASCFLLALLTHHDPQQVEVFIYSSNARVDHITREMQSCGFQWREVALLNDQQLAEQIRGDKVDILVDLTLHMEGSRLLTFAQKPAPIQVNWAYPATSGLDMMDYRFTDPLLDPPPPQGTDSGYSEISLRLPQTFWCYRPMCQTADANPLPAMSNSYFTFGCINNLCKVTPDAIALWSRVLAAVPNSRFLLLARSGEFPPHIRSAFQRHDINPNRIDIVPFQPPEEYFKLFHRIDLCLDPIPYPGHTSTMDGLWMGVPSVTLAENGGSTSASRGGVSLLTNVNLPQFITRTKEEYVSVAVQTAANISGLAQIRATLRQKMQASPLTDAKAFAGATERIYREIWRKYCAEARA